MKECWSCTMPGGTTTSCVFPCVSFLPPSATMSLVLNSVWVLILLSTQLWRQVLCHSINHFNLSLGHISLGNFDSHTCMYFSRKTKKPSQCFFFLFVSYVHNMWHFTLYCCFSWKINIWTSKSCYK